jgi:hypothetical protein
VLKLNASLKINKKVEGTSLALDTKINNPKMKYRITIIGTNPEVTRTIDLSPPKITTEVNIVKITPITSFQLPSPISKIAFGFRTSMYD